MSRRLERLGIWLGATVGGGGLVYAALTAPTNTVPALLGILWVLGVALLAVGILGFASETVSFVNRVLADEQPVRPEQRRAEAPPKVRIPSEPQPASQEAERLFVQVTPEYLVGLFESHTTREATQLVADFIGKWMPVTGKVQDVAEYSTELFVQIRGEVPNPRLVSLSFRGKWAERVSTLRRGDLIRAIGKIDKVDTIALRLDSAELPLDDQSSSPAIS